MILDVRLVDVPAGVTHEEGHTGLIHLPSAVLALIFFREKDSAIIPFPRRINRSPLVGHFLYFLYFCFFVRKNPGLS